MIELFQPSIFSSVLIGELFQEKGSLNRKIKSFFFHWNYCQFLQNEIITGLFEALHIDNVLHFKRLHVTTVGTILNIVEVPAGKLSLSILGNLDEFLHVSANRIVLDNAIVQNEAVSRC